MPITVNCPTCDRPLQVPDALVGKHVQCIRCQTVFVASTTLDRPLRTESVKQPPSPEMEPKDIRATDYSANREDMVPCPQCRQLVRREVKCCRHCGHHLETEPPVTDRAWEHSPAWQSVRRDCEPHRGPLVLTLGIASIALTTVGVPALCCWFLGLPVLLIGLGLGVTAWVMGQRDLRQMQAGQRDPNGQGLTQAGWICGIIGSILNGLGMLVMLVFIAFFIIRFMEAAPQPPPAPRSTQPTLFCPSWNMEPRERTGISSPTGVLTKLPR